MASEKLSLAGRAKSKRLALRYRFTRESPPTHHVCKRDGGDYVPNVNDYVYTTTRDAACSFLAAYSSAPPASYGAAPFQPHMSATQSIGRGKFVYSQRQKSEPSGRAYIPPISTLNKPATTQPDWFAAHGVGCPLLSKAALVTAAMATPRNNVQFQTDKCLTTSARRSSLGLTDQRLLSSVVMLVCHRIRHSRPTSGYLTFIHRVAEHPTGDHPNRQCRNLMESR